jgi:signal transduction histidine kinase
LGAPASRRGARTIRLSKPSTSSAAPWEELEVAEEELSQQYHELVRIRHSFSWVVVARRAIVNFVVGKPLLLYLAPSDRKTLGDAIKRLGDQPTGEEWVVRLQPRPVREADPALWAADARDARHLEMLRVMHTRSFLRVPLCARGQTLGVLSVGYEGDRRRYGSSDLTLIEELARPAAMAVDNARLHRDAQVANAAKDRFLAVLSHELRTPLTPIQATAELLRRVAGDPDRVRTAADVLERNVCLQASLLNDLLDISRVTQGRSAWSARPSYWGLWSENRFPACTRWRRRRV